MQTLPGTHFSALAIEGRIYEYDLSAFNLYVARPPHRWSAVHDKPNPLLAAAVALSTSCKDGHLHFASRGDLIPHAPPPLARIACRFIQLSPLPPFLCTPPNPSLSLARSILQNSARYLSSKERVYMTL
jgi:hypothetical protein